MTSNQENNNQEAMDLEKTNSEEIKIEEQSIEIEDRYKFGWSNYSEITNGRFAMLGSVSYTHLTLPTILLV